MHDGSCGRGVSWCKLELVLLVMVRGHELLKLPTGWELGDFRSDIMMIPLLHDKFVEKANQSACQ